MSKEDQIKLLRHQLASIDLSDVEEEEMTEAERHEYCAAISAVFPRLERDVKKFLHYQLIFLAENAQNWDQVIFARGTYNGLNLLYDHWKQAHTEHTKKVANQDEKLDKYNPVGEFE